MSDSPTPVVTAVASQGDSATFEFEDGHRVVFVGYSHGTGYQLDGLRHFFLFNGEVQVVQYDSRLRRSGSGDGEHQFVQVAQDYDLECIASYWDAAEKYAYKEYFAKPHRDRNEDLWFPWRVSDEGRMDLRSIKGGLKELPAPSAP